MTAADLEKRIAREKVRVAVVGLGYVGLPLACAFAKSGIRTLGVDISSERVKRVRACRSYIDDISDAALRTAVKRHGLGATTRFQAVRRVDAVIICVPTPLGKTKQPDLSFVLAAVRSTAAHMRRGQLIVLESTTYPGTTEENLLPMIEKATGFRCGKDFFLGFSPERVDPANRRFAVTEIPKVVGGADKTSAALIRALYGKVFRTVVPVSNAKTAEMVKLLENTFRSVNIGLINEMAMVCYVLGIDIWEVIAAAKTKPFGFMPFYPGPGIGGHCINIDPMYLAWKARVHGFEPRMIELAQTINDKMPELVAERAARILNERRRPVRGSKVLVVGVAYKKNVRDTRESPALTVMSDLARRGARLFYHDPHVNRVTVEGRPLRSSPLSRAFVDACDLVIILTDHDRVDYRVLSVSKTPVFDTRNAMGGLKQGRVIRL